MKTIPVLLAIFFFLLISGCSRNRFLDNDAFSPPLAIHQSPYVEGSELFALAETEFEAKEIAQIYGIDFVSFSSGVAVFHTEEDPNTLVIKGQENGWPVIEVNYYAQAFAN